jgi:hypothetical protein
MVVTAAGKNRLAGSTLTRRRKLAPVSATMIESGQRGFQSKCIAFQKYPSMGKSFLSSIPLPSLQQVFPVFELEPPPPTIAAL